MLLAAFSLETVRKAIWASLSIGTWVYHDKLGLVQVVEKDVSQKTGKWRFWVRTNQTSVAVDPVSIRCRI